MADRNDSLPESRLPQQVDEAQLQASLIMLRDRDALPSVALYADSVVPYASVVRVLDMAARNNIKMVLATRPVSGIYPAP